MWSPTKIVLLAARPVQRPTIPSTGNVVSTRDHVNPPRVNNGPTRKKSHTALASLLSSHTSQASNFTLPVPAVGAVGRYGRSSAARVGASLICSVCIASGRQVQFAILAKCRSLFLGRFIVAHAARYCGATVAHGSTSGSEVVTLNIFNDTAMRRSMARLVYKLWTRPRYTQTLDPHAGLCQRHWSP